MQATADRSLSRALAGVTLAVAYGTLLPFQLSLTGLIESNWSALLDPRAWNASGLEDILVNLIVYLPVGWVFGHFGLQATALGRLRSPSARAQSAGPGVFANSAARAVIFAAILSLTLERIQATSPFRYASGLDVLLNMTGALCGYHIAAVTRFWHAGFTAFIRRHPWGTCHAALGFSMLAIYVLPADFVLDSRQLWDRLLAASCAPVSPAAIGIGLTTAGAGKWLLGACAAFMLGFSGVRAILETGEDAAFAIPQSALNGVILITLAFLLQLLVRSHELVLGEWPVACALLVIGCFTVGSHEAARIRFRTNRPQTAPRFLLPAIVAAIAAGSLMVASGERHTDVTPSATSLSLLPFHMLWKTGSLEASRVVLLATLQSAALTIPLILLQPDNARRMPKIAAAVTALAALQVLLVRWNAGGLLQGGRFEPFADTAWPLVALLTSTFTCRFHLAVIADRHEEHHQE